MTVTGKVYQAQDDVCGLLAFLQNILVLHLQNSSFLIISTLSLESNPFTILTYQKAEKRGRSMKKNDL